MGLQKYEGTRACDKGRIRGGATHYYIIWLLLVFDAVVGLLVIGLSWERKGSGLLRAHSLGSP
jgi:hypothetical protein